MDRQAANCRYLVKTLSHDQVKVQPTESTVYTAIIKALMDRNTEFHTYKPRQDRSFRVVLKNLHPSTDVNDIKQALKEEGHDVTNVWNVKQRTTNKPLPIHFVDIKPHTTNKDIYIYSQPSSTQRWKSRRRTSNVIFHNARGAKSMGTQKIIVATRRGA